MLFLTAAELIHIAERATGGPVQARDHGLLEAAAARPRASVAGQDAYPTLVDKTAALMHSLARNHALVDGNKRLALAGAIAFLGLNGHRLALTNDEAYDLTVAIAAGDFDDVPTIAAHLADAVQPWRAPRR